ncbi:uncharacterized protein PV09_06587 [Verruconis gallopava]|uniref:Uncharacterized protein n=1 Tax=Verruconis gallopava TaxID=253628 RepID=A0A0D1YMX5_9PEZI|nr:uncharacterized protein PV09_06587 [Verruconis gallopava]KIW02097.1 hypothetical protein PV09_06587 [Verruconis gallopava]
MPFDFKKYDAKCAEMNAEQLQLEWQHYTRQISGAATSTTVSGLAMPFTAGVSAIGVGLGAPTIHNARKKREIIEKHLQRLGTTHNTRKRDVMGSMAFSGTVGVLTLGVGSMGAEHVASAGAEHGISAIVNNETAIKVGIHAALDGAAMAAEEAHHAHLKEKDANKMIAKAEKQIASGNAQAQAQVQAQAQGEKATYQNPMYTGEPVYAAVPIPGAFTTTSLQGAPPQQADIKYTPSPTSDIKYPVPPTPQYTPAPPAYPGPPSAVASPMPQYNPQHYAPPPSQASGPLSPVPTVSSISSYSSQPGQSYTPVSATSQTQMPQVPAYVPPPPVESHEPHVTVQNLPPFQSHVAAPGFQAPAPTLVWSQEHGQWIARENTTPSSSHPTIAPIQQHLPVTQEYGYPFPQQPVDRRSSVYVQTPTSEVQQCQNQNLPQMSSAQTPAQVPETPAPQQYASAPQSQATSVPASPAPQQYYTTSGPQKPAIYAPPQAAQNSLSMQEFNQAPTQITYGYPTPSQTPGVSQPMPNTQYFTPPPGAQSAPPYTPAPQYAPVSTPQPYPPHRDSISSTQPPQQSSTTSPPPEQNYGVLPSYHPQNHYAAQRHGSMPALAPEYEKMHQAWPQTARHSSIVSPPPYAPGTAPAPQQQPAMQGLIDAYGGMKI